MHLLPPSVLPSRYPAEEGAGAEGAGGQEGARRQRRGHHPVAPHRRGVQRVGRRLRARRERVVRLKTTKQKKLKRAGKRRGLVVW